MSKMPGLPEEYIRSIMDQPYHNDCPAGIREIARLALIGLKSLSQPPQSVKDLVDKIGGILYNTGSVWDNARANDALHNCTDAMDGCKIAVEQIETLIESHVQERLRVETEKLTKALEQAATLAEIKIKRHAIVCESHYTTQEAAPELAEYLRSTPDGKGVER